MDDMKTGLILFAHGARDPRWAAPFEAVAARVRAQRPEVAVRLAFLEIMSPSLPDAGAELAAQGCQNLQVLPLFLGAGGHVEEFERELEREMWRITLMMKGEGGEREGERE